jgi:hypothetical protein
MSRDWIVFLAGVVSGVVLPLLSSILDSRLELLPPLFAKIDKSERYNVCNAIQDSGGELFVGTSTEPSYMIDTHWSSTFHRCIIRTTVSDSSASTVERISTLDPTTLLASIAIDSRTQTVEQCDIWLDWNAAGNLIAAPTPVPCSSQKEFDNYVMPLMDN